MVIIHKKYLHIFTSVKCFWAIFTHDRFFYFCFPQVKELFNRRRRRQGNVQVSRHRIVLHVLIFWLRKARKDLIFCQWNAILCSTIWSITSNPDSPSEKSTEVNISRNRDGLTGVINGS